MRTTLESNFFWILGDEVILSGMGISASYPLVSFFTYEIILFYGSDSDIDLVLSINQA